MISNVFCLLSALVACAAGMAVPNAAPSPYANATAPATPTGYSYGFQNLTCAVQISQPANAYETFALVDSAQACGDMCTAQRDCMSANFYHDNGSVVRPFSLPLRRKHGTDDHQKKNSTQLTCSLYRVVAGQKDATNCGHQLQLGMNGMQNSITYSYLLVKGTQ
ncbi:unnamed protein product [Mycena citricolor]|uniref:Apple domain-containing protein n=1 Tax=Mycena citricolor TaxID=2018698 RepID=A0AAD2H097_9AGAR|nr:unnamed protein product [Mycena citricolor]